ncbi:DUF6440 family protein [Staphylococcus saprophyticus]|uniref:DUF6440 family protein n=1 Tax=Staphylococcus saprophyticus TaxID=29385 RepID=UPI00289E59D5|nr:DUF6440 family protein [Staphylococcus saprophyticus]
MNDSERFEMTKPETKKPKNTDMYIIKDHFTGVEYLYISVGYSGSMIKLDK